MEHIDYGANELMMSAIAYLADFFTFLINQCDNFVTEKIKRSMQK
jgi:hypothetical protein